MKTLRAAGLHDRGTQIIGIKHGHDLDASGGPELPDELRRQLRGFEQGDCHGGALRLLDIQPDAHGNHVVTIDQDGTDVLVPPGCRRRLSGPTSWPSLAFLESSITT